MCGIVGVVGPGATDPSLVEAMAGALRHRGPDDGGSWADPEVPIAFGHRRLAVVDLTPAGHQPIHSADGRWVLNYNGEIYNHREIRATLEAGGLTPERGWRGHGDSETLVAAIAAWGIDRTLDAVVGMFAFAAFDRSNRTLTLVRDRFGEKPLYYGWAGRDLVFASELKAMRIHPDFDLIVEPRALPGYVATGTIGGHWSVHRRVFKLPPGMRIDFDLSGGAPPPLDTPPTEGETSGRLRLTRYWDYRAVVLAGLADPISDESDALDALDAVLREAIEGQALADVPVGAFLSGGIDSSTIVALYQAVSNRTVRTFTIGFDDPTYDESGQAAAVAAKLGTEHTTIPVRLDDAREVIPLLPAIYDEPFADSSQIPTYLVSKLARDQVTVALTGDGGDELFGGYNRHVLAPALWRRIGGVPRPLRQAILAPAALLPDAVLAGAGGMAGLSEAVRRGGKVRKFVRTAALARSFDEVADSFLDDWHGESSPLLTPTGGERDGCDLPDGAPAFTRITYRDATTYLPDDILVKVDRASMAVSLETRVPFLDHRVAAVAARIAPDLKVGGGRGKLVLRRLLARHLPAELIERPKAGFGIPLGDWLKGPLRDWAESLLDPRALIDEGLFDADVIGRRWRDHLSGRRDSTQAIWSVLMFESWRRSVKESPIGE